MFHQFFKTLLHLFIFIGLVIVQPIIGSTAPEQGPGGSRDRSGNEPGTVHGMLLDDELNEALMYASVVLHLVSDSAMVSGAITDESGRFVIESVPNGHYYLVVNYVGYPRHEINDITITPRQPVHDAGTIKITPDVSVLGEVTVEATRELMEVGLDRRVFNVDQELTSIGGSALDLMQNIPSVAVDFDGNVSLRGSDNVTILIDGRPSGLLGLTGSEALEQLPSEMVERVEVITNPSVRYDPDGTSGIINIVMKKERRRGYNGMVSLNASPGNRYSGSLNLNYHTGPLNFFGTYSGRLYNMDGFGSNYRTSFLADTTHLDQDMVYENDMDAHNFTVGFDYTLNQQNTLTASIGYNMRDMNWLNDTEYFAYDDQETMTDGFLRESSNIMDHGGYQLNLSHRKTFDEEYREWTTDFTYSNRDMSRAEENEQRFFDQFAKDRLDIYENTSMNGGHEMFRLQTDYIHPMGADSKLELGAQAYLRERGSDFAFFDYDNESESFIINDGLSNEFIHSEQRFSGWGVYSTMLGKYSIQGGLRFEQAFNQIEQLTMDDTYDNNYFSLFPSLHIRRNLTDKQSIQLSQSRRISRPYGRQMNPFPSYNNPYDISSGNPMLNPAYTTSVELGYARYGDRTTINPSIFYRHTDGMVTRFRTMNDEGIAFTTYENLNRGISYGAEMAFTHRLLDFWMINGTLSYFYRTVEGGDERMELQNESYSWSTRMVNNFTFPKDWSAQLTGYYRSPMVMIQGEMKEMYSADLAVRKNVLGNSGTVTLRLSDIFNTQRFQMYNYGDNFIQDSERRRTSRMIYVGFTYRINQFDRNNNRRNRDGIDDNGDMDFDGFEM